MLFRPQMGGLSDAMKYQRELPDRAALAQHLRDHFEVELVEVKPYCADPDSRIAGWNATYLVLARWRGGMVMPVGYVNEAVDG